MEFVLAGLLVIFVWAIVVAKVSHKTKKYAPNVHRHLSPNNRNQTNCTCRNHTNGGNN
jgi:hypothetical protein